MGDEAATRRPRSRVDLGMGLYLNIDVVFDRPAQKVVLDLEIQHQFHQQRGVPLNRQVHRVKLSAELDDNNLERSPETRFHRVSPQLGLEANINSEDGRDQNQKIPAITSSTLLSPVVLSQESFSLAEGESELVTSTAIPSIQETRLEPRTLQNTEDGHLQPTISLKTITSTDDVFEYVKSLPISSPAHLTTGCETCHICLGTLGFVKLPCGHHFGAECLFKWLTPSQNAQHNTCPMCRAVLFETADDLLTRWNRDILRLLDVARRVSTPSDIHREISGIVELEVDLWNRLTELNQRHSEGSEEWRLGMERAGQEHNVIATRLTQFFMVHGETINRLDEAHARLEFCTPLMVSVPTYVIWHRFGIESYRLLGLRNEI